MENTITMRDAGGVRRLEGAWAIGIRPSLYWLATSYVVLTSFLAGIAAIVHASPLFEEVLRLGYPPHFSTLLGMWKVLGAAALAIPRRPLLKEWAYAGLFVDFSGAIVAYAAAGDEVSSFVAPVLAMGALITSWCLRPSSRRLAASSAQAGSDR